MCRGSPRNFPANWLCSRFRAAPVSGAAFWNRQSAGLESHLRGRQGRGCSGASHPPSAGTAWPSSPRLFDIPLSGTACVGTCGLDAKQRCLHQPPHCLRRLGFQLCARVWAWRAPGSSKFKAQRATLRNGSLREGPSGRLRLCPWSKPRVVIISDLRQVTKTRLVTSDLWLG